MKLPGKRKNRKIKKKILVQSNDSDHCAYYLCDELDCGFYYCYKQGRGPSKYRPLLSPPVFVVDLNKSVTLRLVGWGKEGFSRLLDHGHEGYIFPVHLHDKPFRVEPKLGGEEDEKWKKLVAGFKGEEYKSTRKSYILVDKDNNIMKRKICNEEEFEETLEYHRDWQKRHPENEAFLWKLEN